MSIKVNAISKYFGSQKALDNVSFEIAEGEVVGFLGPNGAGKSTMMKIATGYVHADSGSVEIYGNMMNPENIELRRLIGYLPEHNPLYTEMYIREYLMMVGMQYKLDKTRLSRKIEEIIDITGITSESHKKIGSLSKGYRQRVGIAQAIIGEPRVIILDEPTTGLDPNQIVYILNLIRELGKSHTVILSTHIMQEVEAICDRVIIIDHGAIKADGRVEDIASRFNSGQRIKVQYTNPVPSNIFNKADFIDRVTEQGDNIYIIESSFSEDIRPLLFKNAVDNNLIMVNLSKITDDMESLFHKLTV